MTPAASARGAENDDEGGGTRCIGAATSPGDDEAPGAPDGAGAPEDAGPATIDLQAALKGGLSPWVAEAMANFQKELAAGYAQVRKAYGKYAELDYWEQGCERGWITTNKRLFGPILRAQFAGAPPLGRAGELDRLEDLRRYRASKRCRLCWRFTAWGQLKAVLSKLVELGPRAQDFERLGRALVSSGAATWAEVGLKPPDTEPSADYFRNPADLTRKSEMLIRALLTRGNHEMGWAARPELAHARDFGLRDLDMQEQHLQLEPKGLWPLYSVSRRPTNYTGLLADVIIQWEESLRTGGQGSWGSLDPGSTTIFWELGSFRPPGYTAADAFVVPRFMMPPFFPEA